MNRSSCFGWMTRREGAGVAVRSVRRGAFSLLELSVVIIIIGVIAGVALSLKQSGAEDCVSVTKAQMKDIQGAMERFVNQNERYPLPAVRTAGVEDVKYGREVNPADLLANPGLLDVTTPPVTTPPTSSVTVGALPFQALGLAPSYAGDCWGNKFSYAVTTDLTETGKFNQQLPLQTYEGVITVKSDASAAPVSVKAAYVAVSHGANALGAVKTNYTSITGDKRYCTLGSTLDSENCEPSNAVFVAAAYNDGKDAGAKFFDDIIIFSDKKQRSISGVCNNSAPNTCMVGSASNDNGLTACGTTRTWTCDGSGGGINAPCTFANPVCATCGPEPTITALWRLYGSTSDSFIYPSGQNALPRNNCPAGYTPTAMIDDNDGAHTLAEDKSSGGDRSQLCLGTSDTNVQFTSVWAAACPAGTIDTGVYDSDCGDFGEHKLYEEVPKGCRYRWCLGITGTASADYDLKVQRPYSAACPAGWTWMVGAHNEEWDVNNEDGAINRALCIKLDYKPTSTCVTPPPPPPPPPPTTCTPCVEYAGTEVDLYGFGFAGANSRGCWNYTHADCHQEGDLAPCDGTPTTPPPGWAICSGGGPTCTADGQPSGGNPASCCNGDSDGNGTCGTQGGSCGVGEDWGWCTGGTCEVCCNGATGSCPNNLGGDIIKTFGYGCDGSLCAPPSSCAPSECDSNDLGGPGNLVDAQCSGCNPNGTIVKTIGFGCRNFRCNSGTWVDMGSGAPCPIAAACY